MKMLSTMNIQQQSGTETPCGALKVSDLEHTMNVEKVRENNKFYMFIKIHKDFV